MINAQFVINQRNNVDNLHLIIPYASMKRDEITPEHFGVRRQQPLVLEVRDELERIILCGEVPAGERLNEHSLAAQMGVSRGPVREAARSLERDGLVTTIANQGVFVRKLSIEDALELYDVRAVLAGHLCGRAAENASQATRDDLRARVTRMAEAIVVEDEATYFSENLAFHDRIAESAETRRAAAHYIALGKEVRLFRLLVLSGNTSLVASNAEHDRIVSAIERGDVGEAQKEGQAHHIKGKERLLDTL
ncbi:MAG: DNA-binding GntR family transcriptional regulator [Dinoroseobacter sp.]